MAGPVANQVAQQALHDQQHGASRNCTRMASHARAEGSAVECHRCMEAGSSTSMGSRRPKRFRQVISLPPPPPGIRKPMSQRRLRCHPHGPRTDAFHRPQLRAYRAPGSTHEQVAHRFGGNRTHRRRCAQRGGRTSVRAMRPCTCMRIAMVCGHTRIPL